MTTARKPCTHFWTVSTQNEGATGGGEVKSTRAKGGHIGGEPLSKDELSGGARTEVNKEGGADDEAEGAPTDDKEGGPADGEAEGAHAGGEAEGAPTGDEEGGADDEAEGAPTDDEEGGADCEAEGAPASDKAEGAPTDSDEAEGAPASDEAEGALAAGVSRAASAAGPGPPPSKSQLGRGGTMEATFGTCPVEPRHASRNHPGSLLVCVPMIGA